MKNTPLIIIATILFLWGCQQEKTKIVNVYTHRHYQADEQIFTKFSKETGIKVNVIKASADQLIGRLELEGENTPADLLITVDAGRLWRAKMKGLLQPVESEILKENIPSYLKDKENYWFGLTYRSRVIAYNKERVDPSKLSTYEALTNEEWTGRFLPRTSASEYNQALMASLIAHDGLESALLWANNMTKNFARTPKGSETETVQEIANGKGDVSLINTYYLAKMTTSGIPEEQQAAARVGVFFPNQQDRGAHINISGAGVTKYAKNKDHAVLLLEFLSKEYAQKIFTDSNFEYPVNPKVEMCKTLAAWGNFKVDTLDLSLLGEHSADAMKVFDRARWN